MKQEVKKAMPMIMLAFVLAGSMQEALNISAPLIIKDYAIDSAAVSMIAAVAMLTMGVSYVFYTALSDYISIKKLLIIGTLISAVGSLGAVFLSQSFIWLVIFRAIQMAGGTSASALLILTATRYLDVNTRMKYYGYNTACFSGGQIVGILAGGLFASYLEWKYLLILPLVSIINIPFVIKYLPDDAGEGKRKIDFIGISLLAGLSLLISLYFNLMNTNILLLAVVLAVVFLLYISKNNNAFITIDFFKNKSYMLVMLIVLVTYITQGSYSFLFSFMASNIHQIQPSQISMVLLPSYFVSMIIGIFGGRITQKVGVFPTLNLGLGSMFVGLLIGSFYLDKSLIVLLLVSTLFNGGFSILYTPVMTLVMDSLPESMRGTGLGFFNLCIKITSSSGIVITGRMLASPSLQKHSIIQGVSQSAVVYSNVLLAFLLMAVISILTINLGKRKQLKIRK
ncbi:MFS transporter [Enterococcus faecalis]|uniref:MFS transporter n=1 Tax=Enterococcus faecalis TaxID=1351 RepID=UPI0024589A7B|nr:MFS transporter [Enterococcus faecalis]MDH5031805.1 MFS transporter [Enterococcus faecalis]